MPRNYTGGTPKAADLIRNRIAELEGKLKVFEQEAEKVRELIAYCKQRHLPPKLIWRAWLHIVNENKPQRADRPVKSRKPLGKQR